MTPRQMEYAKLHPYDRTDKPSAGSACAWCKTNGHFCPARGFCGAFAVCESCGIGEPCSHDQAVERRMAGPEDFEAEANATYSGPVREIPVTDEIRAADTATASREFKPSVIESSACSLGCGRPTHRGICRGRQQAKPERKRSHAPKPDTSQPRTHAVALGRGEGAGPTLELAHDSRQVGSPRRSSPMRTRQPRSFTVQAPVALQAVPPAPVTDSSRGKYQALFGQVLGLAKETALPVGFDDPSHGKATLAALREIAKKQSRRLQHSRSGDGLTFYFWTETQP